MSAIPFVDLKRIHTPLTETFVDALRQIMERSEFVKGAHLSAFERAFGEWVGSPFCLGISSGYDAELIGLRVIGVQPGDRVVAPAMTFIATVAAVTTLGAVPVLVDVDSHSLMDMDQAEQALKEGARWLLPVHLYGKLVDPLRLTELATKYGAGIFEDACQAHGAAQDGYRAGTIGQGAAFSFYAGKNLGALGDGGALCLQDEEQARFATALREHGQTRKYHHEYEGYTARLDNLQAAFLSAKLSRLGEWNQMRIDAARYYAHRLQGLPHFTLQCDEDDFSGRHVFHLFVGLTPLREELSQALTERKIGFGYHYPSAIHQLDCYQGKVWAKGKSFPNAERFAREGISLPMFPGLTEPEMDAVIDVVRGVCG